MIGRTWVRPSLVAWAAVAFSMPSLVSAQPAAGPLPRAKAASITVLVTSAVSPAPGQTVTLTATVSPSSASGNLTFSDGNASLATVPISNGTAALATANLLAGNHSLNATYNGDNNFIASTSAAVVITVGAARVTTVIGLAALPNPATFGQAVTLSATVIPTSATGTITLRDGNVILGTGTISSGAASLTTSAFAPGSHTLTASYGGDSNNSPSTSSPVTETITPAAATAPTATSLSAAPNPATVGQAVTLTATVTPAGAAGTVTFKDGLNTVGTATLSSGSAMFPVSALAAGTHSLTATYGGNSTNSPSQSAIVTVTVTVSAVAATIALSVAPASSSPGQTVTLTATVTPSTATGTVTFKEGSTALGAGTLANGIAVFSTSTLAAGSHILTASYGGDATYATAVSNPVTESVALPATTTILTVAPVSSTLGQSVTLTATVSPASATGSVTLMDGSTILSTAAVTGGVATYTTSTLGIGSHILSAFYGGDSKYGASTSNSVTGSVGKQTSTIVLTASPSQSQPGQAVTLTATVKPLSATGAVAFLDGQLLLGTATLAGGVSVFTTSTLTLGIHTLSSSYGGDTRDSASISVPISQTVVVAASPIQITPVTATPLVFVGSTWSQTFRATGGSPPYKWTMPSSDTPDLAMTSSGDTAVVSGTPQTTGTYQATLRVQDGAGQATTAVFSVTVNARPAVTILVTQPVSPADQPVPQLSIAQPYPFALTGTFTLAFAPNAPGLPAGYNDAMFAGGGTTFQVTIAANSTAPNPPLPPIQLGSVAGDIVGTLGALTIAGSTQTLPFFGPPPNVTITVPALAPIIVPGSVRITNVTASGFQVFMDASSTARDLARGTFVFTAVTGTQMNGCSPNCTVSFGTEASAWFASAAGVSNGGTASLTVPFAFSGDTSVIGSVAVTLTNSIGTSAAVNGGK